MIREDIDKIAASTCIVFLSGLVLFQSCHRASTIYFFELQTTTVIFVEPIPALMLPFALSILLWLVYKGTKRSAVLERERKAIMDKQKEIEAASSPTSRKTSRQEGRRISLTDEQTSRLKRLLSDIQEQDTIHSQHGALPDSRESPIGDGKQTPGGSGRQSRQEDPQMLDSDQQERKPAGASPHISTSESSGEHSPSITTRSRFRCTKIEEPKVILPPGNDCRITMRGVLKWLPHKSDRSFGHEAQRRPIENPLGRLAGLEEVPVSVSFPGALVVGEDSVGVSRKSSVSIGRRSYAGADEPEEEDSERERNEIYMQIGQQYFLTLYHLD
ncbi:hypothetical protein NECAME_05622 [Necator americanus]|uniref:Uncharacterized protein n=1 Tax=Necator americanus TaxID=51031 RepID=W2SFP3_NECAM|nr:hypothetical protein NECAME_05622 [Necator americanus]ETN68434.1 hypothetical protein NECAME_05622 [Necator americanus]